MDNIPELIIIDRYDYTEEFKGYIIYKVLYEGKDKAKLVEQYKLLSLQTITLWIRYFRKRLEKGLISLPPMSKEQKQNLKSLQDRVKELEKSLEQANVLIS